METKLDRLKLHFKYSVVIAVMLLIFTATEKWSGNDDFTTYLSNAATMTSLLLGVVAIFYSFISNDGMSRSLGSIATVSDEVREVRGEIEEFSNLTREATAESANNTVLVRNASDSLTASLEQLSVTLRKISDENNALQGLISDIPSRFEKLELRLGDVANNWGERPQSGEKTSVVNEIPATFIDEFISRLSLTQSLLIYACVLSASVNKPLSVKEFIKVVKNIPDSVHVGFLHCLNATQFITGNFIYSDNLQYKIKYIHPIIVKKTKPSLIEFLDNYYGEGDESKNYWLNCISKIENYFQ